MAIFFQASPVAFFDDRLRDPPPLAVEITEEQHAALLQEQARGKRIVAGPDGMPTTVGVDRTAKVLQVTNYQARAVLMRTNGWDGRPLFDAVNDMLLANKDASAAGRLDWQAWEQANTFSRNGDLISRMGRALKLSDAQLDALFLAASKIEA